MAQEQLKLFCCFVLDEPSIIKIKIENSADVADLKAAIKTNKAKLATVDDETIDLWKVSRFYIYRCNFYGLSL